MLLTINFKMAHYITTSDALCIFQTPNRGRPPTTINGLGNDGLFSELTRPFHSPDHEYPTHREPIHHTKRPYSREPFIYSHRDEPTLSYDRNPPPQKAEGLSNFIENSIGGAFYDKQHDLVVSYKVRYAYFYGQYSFFLVIVAVILLFIKSHSFNYFECR